MGRLRQKRPPGSDTGHFAEARASHQKFPAGKNFSETASIFDADHPPC